MADKSLPFLPLTSLSNGSLVTLHWGVSTIYLVCVYVPPNKASRQQSLQNLDSTLDSLHGKYVIIAGTSIPLTTLSH